jgi:hypothetical protein
VGSQERCEEKQELSGGATSARAVWRCHISKSCLEVPHQQELSGGATSASAHHLVYKPLRYVGLHATNTAWWLPVRLSMLSSCSCGLLLKQVCVYKTGLHARAMSSYQCVQPLTKQQSPSLITGSSILRQQHITLHCSAAQFRAPSCTLIQGPQLQQQQQQHTNCGRQHLLPAQLGILGVKGSSSSSLSSLCGE